MSNEFWSALNKKKREELLGTSEREELKTSDFVSALNPEKQKELLTRGTTDIAPARTSFFDDDDDIAPVKGGNKDSIFKLGAFSEGVDGFADYWVKNQQASLGTFADLSLGLVKGVGRMVEGVVDLGTYGVAGVADLFGADEFAEKTKKVAQYSATDKWTKKATDFVDQYSALGDKADMVSEGLGQVGAIILTGGLAAGAGLGAVGTTALTTGVTGLSGMGSGMNEAYSKGASDGEAVAYGATVGTIEAVSELIFGGLGKGVKAIGLSKGLTSIDDVAAKKISNIAAKYIASEAGQKVVGNTLEYAVKSGAEGLEEVISGFGSAIAKDVYLLNDKDEKAFGEILKDEKLLEQFVVGSIVSGIAQGGDFINSTKSGRDFVSGLSKNEQTVVDKVYEKRLAEESEKRTLSNQDKNKLYDRVVEEMKRGYVSTDEIESILGGETYKGYKDLSEQENALQSKKSAIESEIKELVQTPESQFTVEQRERLNSLREEAKGIKEQIKGLDTKTAKRNLFNEVNKLTSKDTYLRESYNETARRGQAFTADLSQYKGKQREAIERAINSGVLNNTNRSHELVDTLSKIEADKGITFDYTNNEKLKKSGFAVEGKTVNGFVKDGGVTLNIQSPKAWQSTVGHEITHVLEGTEAYGALREALYAYAESKGELASRKTALTELYNGMNADIDAELTADLVGEYLFSDKDFINKLTGNRTLFQKVWDEVKYLCKVATGKELTEIEKVEREFARAWKEQGQIAQSEEYSETDDSGEGDVTYSISVTDKSTRDFLDEQVSRGEYDAETNPDGGYYVTYKSMSFWGYDEEGNAILRSPMAEYVDGELSNAYLVPKDKSKLNWYKSTETIDENTGLPSGLLVKVKKDGNKSFSYLPAAENQDLINEDWSNLYFNLQKKVLKNGKWVNSDVPARYNPYEHSSNSMLNDQFSAAYLRDNLVTVKMYVPVSEDNGTFRAKYSKDATGWADWKTGTVAGKINKQKDLQRKVYLSRYAAPVEIVPDSEVAQAYKEYIDGTDVTIPDNVVSPSLLNELKKAGVPIEESGKVKYSVSEDSSKKDSNGNELSLAVQKRFANSKAVDENGNLKVLYHGTASGEFFTFDKAKGSVEGDFGSGFYFTDNEGDVEANYEGGGPDFENKIARRAEQIEAEEDIDYSEAEARAREELYVGSNKFEVYLNIENPAIVGKTTLFDYDEYASEYDPDDYDSEEDYQGDVEQLIADDIDQIIWDIERNIDIYSTDGIAEVLWNAVNEGGIGIEQLKNKINELYLEDGNGNFVGGEVTRQIIESLGYDGIIDNTVSSKFNMGLSEDTTHYIVFKPNQIKDISNQNPTDNPDIRYSLSNSPLDNGTDLVYNVNGDLSRGDGYARTDEFRRLQAESQRMSDEDTKLYHSGSRKIDEGLRANFARVLRGQIHAYRNGLRNDDGILRLSNEGNEFNMCKSVNGSLFHDCFEISQKFLRNGELVDLHEVKTTEDGIGYDDCDNYLSEDGLSGFSITPYGDLISVFNASGKGGFLSAIAPVVRENAKTLDCYNSPNQPLCKMYEKKFGFKTASVMDYNMEYDHDDIAENHNMPKIAFMVNTESDVETKYFTKDEYDEAVAYRDSFVNQTTDNDIAPTENYSLSNEGERFAPVGNYSTPLNEAALDIAPVAEGVAENAMTTSEAPMPTVPKSTQLADGTRSDELLVESLDNYPMQTIEQKIAENIRAVEGELADNRDLRKEAETNYNEQIAKLQKQYNAKKNKETKVAYNLLQSISRIERLKASTDAKFAKRISDLEARAEKMKDPTYSRALYKKAKMEEHAKWAENLIGDTSTWADKKIGLQYATNTERRNFRDIVRDENGNADIARADAINDALNGQYNRNQAEMNRKDNEISKKYRDLKVNRHESVYANMLGELRHNPETALTEKDVNEYYEKHKNRIDTKKVDKLIDYVRSDLDYFFETLNAKLREQGMKEIPYRKGYFPHKVEPKQNFIQKLLNWKTQDNEIPTSIAGLTEDFKPVKSYQSFDKQRHTDKTDYDLMRLFQNYKKGALDWIYHIEDIQKRRAVENYIRYTHSEEGIRTRIKEVYASEEYDADEAQAQIEHILTEAKNPLNNFVQDFTTHTNILAGKKNSLDRTVEQMGNRNIYTVMQNVQNRTSANMVLANVRSALTNFIPITQSWAQVSPLRSIQATKDTIANAIKDDGLINKSTFLTNRLREADSLYKTNWDVVLDKAGIMFEVIDNFSSQVIWRSKYNQNLSNGMSEAEAIANADQFAENVMAGRSKGNEPTLFNAKNPFVKAFTMFQLEVNNQYGYLFKDVPNDLKAETEHWKLNLAKGYATAFIGAYVYNELLSKLTGSDAALDPIGIIEELLRDLGLFDDDEEKEPDEVITNLFDNVVEELPFVGGLFGGGRIPISSAIPYGGEYGGGVSKAVEDVTKTIGAIGDTINGNFDEADWSGAKNLGKELMNPILNVGLPVGGGQIKKTAQGLSMFSDEHPVAGSYTDSGNLRFPVEDTPLNRIQAGIFGQYASKNAREYFDNDYAPLKEKQIQEYIDVDLPIADYWKYREGLSGLKKNAEKADYINSLDIKDWQKNLLMNNILDRKEDVDMSNYDDYGNYEEFDYAQKNPEKYAFAKSVGGYSAYKTYSDELYDIKADKDASGKSITGSRKEKVLDYINNLNADYETKIILWKSEYPSDDTYNMEIINYINNRTDLTYEERVAILTELGFTVSDGSVYWD